MKIILKNQQNKIPLNPTRIKKTLRKVCSREAKGATGEVTVCFVTDEAIRRFNKQFHATDCATDVLAFDLSSSGLKPRKLCADIIVSVQTAKRQSSIYKTRLSDEILLYAVHGMLHILGFSDKRPHNRLLMRQKEKEYVYT